MMFASLILALAQTAAPPLPADIVVTATSRRKCKVQLEDRSLSNSQLAQRAKSWAASGTPVRVIAPRGAGYRCLAKVAFSLNQHGVTLIQFVDRAP